MNSLSHENELLVTTVRSFMEEELLPHEQEVDEAGEVPEELGRQIEERSKAVGLFAANLPESVGGGGLSMAAMACLLYTSPSPRDS